MKPLNSLFGVAALWGSTVSAASATYSPISDINFAVSIPASTASSGSGSIYFQLSAPTSYSWAALGIGSQMSGATIFVIYTDGSGNVTLSPRSAQGHVMPTLSSTTNAQTTLLAGSGVVNGMMIANVKYTYSGSTLDPTSTSSRWIASWKTGSSLNTKSQSASLTQHDTYAQFTFDLTQASIATDSNPFVAAAADSSSSTGTAATGTGAGSSKASTTVGGVTTATSGSSSGGSSSSGGVVTVDRSQVTTFQHAHGIIMAGAMVVIFPLGAIIFRTFGSVWLHAGIQILGLVAIIAGLGLGIKLAQLTNLLFNNTHSIFGVVIVALFLIQPFLGLLHHRQYQQVGKRTAVSHSHIWNGRILIICGVVNGGLGLALASNAMNSGIIAYSVVAGVIGVVYIAVMVFTARRKAGQANGDDSSGEHIATRNDVYQRPSKRG